MKTMAPRKSVKNLAESIHSLLGLKAHLTSAWVNSVRDIIKKLPTDRSTSDCAITSENIAAAGSDKVDLGLDVLKIRDELAALTANINQLNIQRRQVLNELLDLKGNIRVFCRVRPITSTTTTGEYFGRVRPVVVTLDASHLLLRLTENKSKSYNFDRVFNPASSQDDVFSEVEPIIKSALDGYNACIFAYGQTGTGKTFTMEGSPDCPGIVPRAIEALFKQAVESSHAYLFSFSMLEIYLGNLKDLLAPPPSLKPTHAMPPCLSIKTDPEGGIEIDNLVTIQVSDFNQALRLYKLGCRFRSTASTNSNKTSSRSHCMICFTITCFDAPERQRKKNKLWMVDLGGSERMLKSKAWGTRLEEGKAINLSLSALGDVINALQRKRCHIPYRNSKLTQVLRDSLGEDSKTLMLIHVSPREEDLCETICSLNFATRVRSIHLGHEESSELRDQKELVMINLQQKMKQIEDERQEIRREIKRLNERFEVLERESSSSSELLEASHLITEIPHPSIETRRGRIRDMKATPLSHLPRYMTSTVCSRKKHGSDQQTVKEKDQFTARRPLSHCAESETFPLKNTYEHKSECGISKTSSLTALNMKLRADDETEYSQDTSECDIKIVVFQECEVPPRSSAHQKPHLIDGEGHQKRKSNKLNSRKLMRIDNWLELQRKGTTTIGQIPASKRELAISPERKVGWNEQKNAGKQHGENIHNDEFRNKTINHDRKQKLPGLEARWENNKPLILVNTNFGSKSICKAQSIDARIMMHRRDSVDFLAIEDNLCVTSSPADTWCDRYNDNAYNNRVLSNMQVVSGNTQCFNDSTLDNSCRHFSPSDTDNSIIDQLEHSGVSISISEIQSRFYDVLTDMTLNASNKQDFYTTSSDSEIGTRPCLQKLRSPRALLVDNSNQEDDSMPIITSQGSFQYRGICESLIQKMQTIYGSALLGFGFQHLGYEHDFFYSLML